MHAYPSMDSYGFGFISIGYIYNIWRVYFIESYGIGLFLRYLYILNWFGLVYSLIYIYIYPEIGLLLFSKINVYPGMGLYDIYVASMNDGATGRQVGNLVS